jgi:hypothetical protein
MVFVERRDQQNAADAAALAGARYLTSNTPTAKLAAEGAARDVAKANGFEDKLNAASVVVNIPPSASARTVHRGPGHIEVRISSTRPSIFAGLAGIVDWDISARAVALNGEGALGDFAILALDPKTCNSLTVTGGGYVRAYGDIHVDSDCPSSAFNVGGSGEVSVEVTGYGCKAKGGIDVSNNATLKCDRTSPATALGDPLTGWPVPYDGVIDGLDPAIADTPVLVDRTTLAELAGGPKVPDGCPGADKKPATWDTPQKCEFKGSTYRDTAWRMSPGVYPGGLDLSDGYFYFEPGIYVVAGGGVSIGGGGATARTLTSAGVEVKGYDPTKPEPWENTTFGVMFYNTTHPKAAWGGINFNGGLADFQLLPLHYPDGEYQAGWNGFLVWNDRDYPTKADLSSVTLNGGGSNFEALGLIYSPRGLVTVTGNSNGAEFAVDQVIAWNFQINGNQGSIVAWNNKARKPEVLLAGLVE